MMWRKFQSDRRRSRKHFQWGEELRRGVKREGWASETWSPDSPPYPDQNHQAGLCVSMQWDIEAGLEKSRKAILGALLPQVPPERATSL